MTNVYGIQDTMNEEVKETQDIDTKYVTENHWF